MPDRYDHATADGLDADLRKILRAALAGELPWPLYIWGDVGVGKSCALALFYRYWTGQAFWYSLEAFCDDVMTCRTAGSVTKVYQGEDVTRHGEVFQRSESMLWRFAESRALWVIDDLGVAMPTEARQRVVYRLIDGRARKPTVISSNLSLDRVSEVYDDRIASRLREGTVVHLQGPDRRSGKYFEVG